MSANSKRTPPKSYHTAVNEAAQYHAAAKASAYEKPHAKYEEPILYKSYSDEKALYEKALYEKELKKPNRRISIRGVIVGWIFYSIVMFFHMSASTYFEPAELISSFVSSFLITGGLIAIIILLYKKGW